MCPSSRSAAPWLLGPALGWLAFASACSDAAAPPAPGGPYAVQLHVHGSFSEGIGSMDVHTDEADRLGLDAIWWSDHDHRIASYQHVTRFGFDQWQEPIERGERWTPWHPNDRDMTKGLVVDRPLRIEGRAQFTAQDPFDGASSLRIEARAGPTGAFQRYATRLEVSRFRERRPLASGVTLRIAIEPERCDADVRPFVEVELSQHAREGLSLEPYRIHYFLADAPGDPWRDGTTRFVPLPCRPGEWNPLVLRLTRDVVAGFPGIDGEDNSLHALRFGVALRRGASTALRFDALRIEQVLSGTAAYAKQRELLERLRAEYPRVRQLQGVEISLDMPHLNEFSVGTELLDYDEVAREGGLEKLGREFADVSVARRLITERAVAAAHARGGLVSYNHMFGATAERRERPNPHTKEQVLEVLRGLRVFGADLLEVGYRKRGGRTLADHLWVWDELGRAGVFLVGVGTSDSHGLDPERTPRLNNFVSWIYADSLDAADLIEGLRSGRVFFGDPTRFDGRIDLRTPDGVEMGQIVVSDRASEAVDVEVEGLEAGDLVRIVRGDGVESHTADAREFAQRIALPLSEAGGFVRVEVHGADGAEKAFSNPIHFVRALPEGGLPAGRAAARGL